MPLPSLPILEAFATDVELGETHLRKVAAAMSARARTVNRIVAIDAAFHGGSAGCLIQFSPMPGRSTQNAVR